MTTLEQPAEQCPTCGSTELRRLPTKMKTAEGMVDVEPISSKCDECSLVIMDDGSLIPIGP